MATNGYFRNSLEKFELRKYINISVERKLIFSKFYNNNEL